MSFEPNELWKVAAYENFQEALENQQWELAEDVIADVKDAGFLQTAKVMRGQLNRTRCAAIDGYKQVESNVFLK